MRDLTSRAGSRRHPAPVALLAAAALLLGACGGGGDGDKRADDRPFRPATTPSTATQPAPGTIATAGGKTRRATLADVRAAVDDDRYADAERALPALTAAQRKTIRERVADRLAKRAGAALDRGNAGRVQSMLAQAEKYPETELVEQVREDFEEALAESRQSRRDRLLARQREHRERRQRARAERAAAIAREAQEAKQR